MGPSFFRLEDFEINEEDEEALIEQRRLQRLAIIQVRIYFCYHYYSIRFAFDTFEMSLFVPYRNINR